VRFLNLPFLPESDVKCVLLSAEYFDIFMPKLDRLGIKAVPSPYSPSLPRPVRFHPDMNCRHLGGNRFAVYADALGLEDLTGLGAELIFVDPPKAPEYPHDAALNALPFGKYFGILSNICNLLCLFHIRSGSLNLHNSFQSLERPVLMLISTELRTIQNTNHNALTNMGLANWVWTIVILLCYTFNEITRGKIIHNNFTV